MLQNSRSDDVIRTKIAQAVNIGIVSHIRPDGDAIGATLGLGLALMQAGKKVQMVLKDGISPTFHHLAGVSMVKRKLESECDLVIVLDCSDLARTGGVLKDRKPDINIDHHVTNENFAGVEPWWKMALWQHRPFSPATSRIGASKSMSMLRGRY